MGLLFKLFTCLSCFVLIVRADAGVKDDAAEVDVGKEFTLDENVLVLGKADFKKALEKFKFLLVEFCKYDD